MNRAASIALVSCVAALCPASAKDAGPPLEFVASRQGIAVTNRKGYYAPSDVPVPRNKTKFRP